MATRILLVNPPIYDFSAYDFWLKPYGLLSVGGFLRGQAELRLWDYMDRLSSLVPDPSLQPLSPQGRGARRHRQDEWGRGEYHSEIILCPEIFAGIRRRYRRFGIPRNAFREFLAAEGPFDFALIQTGMTYWYPGVQEVIADLRRAHPQTRIVLGGVYATLCPRHAHTLGADLVVAGTDLGPLWRFLKLAPRQDGLPLWDCYPRLSSGVLKLTDGCPFRCTYCSVPQIYQGFSPRPSDRVLAEADFLCGRDAENIAFYDDALLHQAERILEPFLREFLKRGVRVNFHTPNAINARFVSKDLARLMVDAGFKIIYLGFESSAEGWQRETGGKVTAGDLARAIENLVAAGADPRHLHAYLMLGHPRAGQQQLENSMRFASSLGIRLMLAEFSPLPGTPDGELCRQWVDLDEPLSHNKTAFAIKLLGEEGVNRFKNLCRELNAGQA